MSGYVIRQATPADSPALLKLLAATPQDGSIRLTFEREPDYFHAAGISTEQPDIWVMEQAGHGLIGTFSIGQRRVFINGQPTSVRYGSDLRIHPDFQGGRTLFRLFSQYRQQMQDDWMQTVILDDNHTSLNTVGSGRNILPQYIPVGSFTTWLLSLRRPPRDPADPQVSRATAADIPALQAFFDQQAAHKQFFPCYDFARLGSSDPYYRNLSLDDVFILREGGEITALASLWDQKPFKQTRVSGYAPLLSWLRPLYNGVSWFSGHLPLPAVNSDNSYLMLHGVVVKDNQPQRFARLLRSIRHAAAGRSQAIACGFDSRDPLLAVVRKHPGYALNSRHFIATYQPQQLGSLDLNRLQYPEISRF